MRLDAVDRRVLALAIPALGTLAVEPLYVLADTAIVGHLGTTSLGALALAGTVLNTVLWACNFLQWGTTSRVAFLTGREDHRGAASSSPRSWLRSGSSASSAACSPPPAPGCDPWSPRCDTSSAPAATSSSAPAPSWPPSCWPRLWRRGWDRRLSPPTRSPIRCSSSWPS